MKRTSKLLLLTLVLASVFAFSTGIFADETYVADAVVTVTAQNSSVDSPAEDDFFNPPITLYVPGNIAEAYGYVDAIDPAKGVSALDVLVAYHQRLYTEDSFSKENASKFLSLSGNTLNKAFCYESMGWCFAVNGEGGHTGDMKDDGSYESTNFTNTVINNGDTVDFALSRDPSWKDKMVWFVEDGERIVTKSVAVGESFDINLKSYIFMWESQYGTEAMFKNILKPFANAKILVYDVNEDESGYIEETTDENGVLADVSVNKAGQYYLAVKSDEYIFSPVLVLNVHNVYDYKNFSDLNEKGWYKEPVTAVLDNGLMNGVGDGIFAPDISLTREMFVTILYRAVGSPQSAYYYDFVDVGEERYSYDAINWACEAGIVYGVSDKEWRFAPTDNITREQMAAIMDRFAYAYGIDLSQDKPVVAFKDAAKISDWAKDSVEYLTKAGILSGYPDGTFHPQGNATRAEAAKIITSLMDL